MISFDVNLTVEQEFEIQRALMAIRGASREELEQLFRNLLVLNTMQKNVIRSLVMELARKEG